MSPASGAAVAVFGAPLKSADCGTVVRKAKVSGQLSWSGDCERCQSGCRSVSAEWTRTTKVTADSTTPCHDLDSPAAWQRNSRPKFQTFVIITSSNPYCYICNETTLELVQLIVSAIHNTEYNPPHSLLYIIFNIKSYLWTSKDASYGRSRRLSKQVGEIRRFSALIYTTYPQMQDFQDFKAVVSLKLFVQVFWYGFMFKILCGSYLIPIRLECQCMNHASLLVYYTLRRRFFHYALTWNIFCVAKQNIATVMHTIFHPWQRLTYLLPLKNKSVFMLKSIIPLSKAKHCYRD